MRKISDLKIPNNM